MQFTTFLAWEPFYFFLGIKSLPIFLRPNSSQFTS